MMKNKPDLLVADYVLEIDVTIGPVTRAQINRHVLEIIIAKYAQLDPEVPDISSPDFAFFMLMAEAFTQTVVERARNLAVGELTAKIDSLGDVDDVAPVIDHSLSEALISFEQVDLKDAIDHIRHGIQTMPKDAEAGLVH